MVPKILDADLERATQSGIERVHPWLHARTTLFVASSLKPFGRVWLAALVPAALIAAGTLGYTVVEGWGWFDSLYMTAITLTTIGFSEVHPLSAAGRVLTIFLALGGAFSLAAAATFVLRAVVGGEIASLMGRQRMEKGLASISDHVIVCGFGRVGRLVVADLAHEGVRCVVIDRVEAKLAVTQNELFVIGDVTSDEVLQHAGITRARALVTVVPSDADNLYVTMSARLLNEKLLIVARAEGEGTELKLRRAGANRVISPTAIGGQRVVQAVIRPAVLDFLDLATRTGHLELQVEDALVRPSSPLVGQDLEHAELRRRADVLVVAVQRHDGRMMFNPPTETKLEGGDRIVVLGSRTALDRLEELARGESPA